MDITPLNIKCFYHGVDLDGECSGAIVKRKHPNCELMGLNYGDPFPWNSIKPNDVVYMVDFGLQPFDLMVKLSRMCDLIWIDHHQTALAEAAKRDFNVKGIRQNGKAGCELTWGFCFPLKEMPVAVKYLGRYDVWDKTDSNVDPFQFGMKLEETDPASPIWDRLFVGDEDLIKAIIAKGKLVKHYSDMQNKSYCESYGFEGNFEGHSAVICNKGIGGSNLFDSMWDDKKHDLMITFCKLPHKDLWTVSLYTTKPNVDCGAIAKKYGGGGHKNAAGFQTNDISRFFKK